MSVLLALVLAGTAAAKDGCVSCHAADIDDKQAGIVRAFGTDIHKEKGLSCHSCHGGDPGKDDMAEAMAPEAGFVGVPGPKDMARFCGKCHSDPAYMRRYDPALPTDQEAKYKTSRHGLRLAAGNEAVATCAGCHPAHGIRPPKEPASSVYVKNVHETCAKCHAAEEYQGSVHGKALHERGDTAAPTCSTCHGSHGAAPPGVASVGLVCARCHAANMESFAASPMAEPWKRRKLSACSTCHGHHGVQKPTTELLAADSAVCLRCHEAGSPALAVSAALKEKVDVVEAAYGAAVAAVGRAEDLGMDMADARDALDAARMSMYQARTAVHTFSPEKVGEAAAPGLKTAAQAEEAAEASILDFRNRRVGLGLATLVMTFLVLALYLKLRDIESGRT